MHAVSEDDLRRALAEQRFVLFYQPQYAADGATMLGVEALVRLRAPDGHLIPPQRFIPVAEGTGFIKELGLWVLQQACTDALAWPSLTVAVNVSPVQFQDARFVETVEMVLCGTALPHQRLEIEITESAYFEDIEAADIHVRRLRAMGVKVALDDFGTGYASLTYLHRLALDKLKIDKSFVAKVDRIDCAAIVQAITAIGRALGLKILAEGVETPEQHKFLRVSGCHMLQGFLFSVPLPAEAITAMLAVPAAAAPKLPPMPVPKAS